MEQQRKHGRTDALPDGAAARAARPTKTLRQTVVQIVIADLSMSMDNVLAGAGIARDQLWAESD